MKTVYMRMPKKYGVSPLTLLKFAAEENRLGDVERATLFNVLKKVDELKDLNKGIPSFFHTFFYCRNNPVI